MNTEGVKENKVKSLTKEDIIEILNSNVIASVKTPLVGALNRLGIGMPLWMQFIKGLGFTLLLAAGLIGYYIQWHAEIKQRQAETTARAVAQLQKTIDRKIEWQIKLNNSMVSLKSNAEMIQLDCKDNVPLSEHEVNRLRLLERVKVVYALMGTQYIFNEQVLNGARDYVNYDESILDLCAKDAPTEMSWRKILIQNNDLMGQSIKKDQELLNRLNSITTREG